MSNRLQNETSPYLLQHAENPVDWYPWSEEALMRAKEEDKPIFLSIGYAACHWCHVMAHESFEDLETAKIMNESFINIKVDREERPDLDSLYMDAVVAITGQGGWPMSVFLTPEGKPFHGGTYFPPSPRFNLPSFKDLLTQIAKLWQQDRSRLLEISNQLGDHIASVPLLITTDNEFDRQGLDRAAETLFNLYDWKGGGWGSAPKFPQSIIIEFLFRRYHRLGDKLALDMATHALRSMAKGGMYDLVGGGFHRYSVDDHWLVPHFEKMLYDNALLIPTYLHAWQITNDPEFRQIATESLAFLKREMFDDAGGFYSSLDADSEGEEGLYYIWSLDEIREIFEKSEDSELIIEAFGITEEGNFEGRNIPFRSTDFSTLSKKYQVPPEKISTILERAKGNLLEQRDKRIRPDLDDKILTSWNGLLLSALSIASRVLDSQEFKAIAQGLARFLLEELQTQSGLKRSWRQGSARFTAYLQDHAALGLGMLDLYQTDLDPRWYDAAVNQAEEILTHFSDPVGGFFDTRDDHEKLIARPKSIQDTPIPSSNTLATSLLLRLAALTGYSRYREPAESALKAMQENATQHPSAFAGWLCEIDFALGPQLQLAIVGQPDTDRFQSIKAIADHQYLPNLVLAGGIPNRSPKPTLLEGRSMIDELPTAYLCLGFNCKLPVHSPDELASQISQVDVD